MHFPEQQLTTYLRVFLPDTRIDAVLDEIAEAALESDVADTVTFFSLAHWLMDSDDRRTPAMEAVVLVEEVGLSDADVAVILDQDVVEVERAVAQAWDATGLNASGEAAQSDSDPVVLAIDGSQIEVDAPDVEDDEVEASQPTSVLEPTDAESVGKGVENDLAASTVLDATSDGEHGSGGPDIAPEDPSDVEPDVAPSPVAASPNSRWGAFEIPESEVRPEDAQADAAAVLAAIDSATGQRQRQVATEALTGSTASGPEAQGRFDPSLILKPLVTKVTPAPPDEDTESDEVAPVESPAKATSEEWAAAYEEAKADDANVDETDEPVEVLEAAEVDDSPDVEDAATAEEAADTGEPAAPDDTPETGDTAEPAIAQQADAADGEAAEDADEDADREGASAADTDTVPSTDTVPDTDVVPDSEIAGATPDSDGVATQDHAELLANLPEGQIRAGSDGPDSAAADLDGAQETPQSRSGTVAAATAQGDGSSKAMSVFRVTLGVLALTGVAVLGFAVFSQAGRDRLSAQGFDPLTAFMVVVGFLGLGMLLLILGGRRRTVRGLEEAGRSWSRATPSAEVARASKAVKSGDSAETSERGDQPQSSTR